MFEHSVKTLREGCMVNDEAMNNYMAMLSSPENPGGGDAMFWPTHFYTKFEEFDDANDGFTGIESWVRGLDKPSYRKVFVPVHTKTPEHWFLITIDFEEKTVLSLDSLSGGRKRATQRRKMMEWTRREWNSCPRWKGEFRAEEWSSRTASVPKQTNDVDCGVFTCMYAAFVSNGREMTFSQGDVPGMRARMAWSILHRKL
ncbi:unnamed protein product [Ectocarpus sp. 6 AP-2014]